MSDISKAISDWNIPKQLLDKGEAAFKAVLGPSVKEIAETWADSFKLRRFKNQVNILAKAQKILEEKKINAKKIDLKVLVPMLENSSLEEDEDLQERWANLIANIVTIDGRTLLKQNCIDILRKVSNDEVHFLEKLFFDDIESHEFLKRSEIINLELEPRNYVSEINSIAEDLSLKENVKLIVANLISLGLIERSIQTEAVNVGEYIIVEKDDTNFIKLTQLGTEFVRLCKGGDI